MRVLLTIAVALSSIPRATSGADLDQAFRQYWQARTIRQMDRAAAAIVDSGVAFERVWEQLGQGRPYSGHVKTGLLLGTRVGAMGFRHHYAFRVPEQYDPQRQYPVLVYLHGGIEREEWDPGGGWWPKNKLTEHPERIAVFPSAWNKSMWWQESQVRNLAEILFELKRTYNIDENRVSLLGVSDGGTGVWFHAFRSTTPWAAFLPFIGHPAVLGNSAIAADGDMFPANLANKPFLVINGAYDHLYPSAMIVPYLALFQEAGARIEFRHQPDSGHDTRWWPLEIPNIDRFLAHHPRDPLPDRLVWETERNDRYNRAHWLVIDELGKVDGEKQLPVWNSVKSPYLGPSLGLIPRDAPGGVEIVAINSEGIGEAAGLQPGDLVTELGSIRAPTIADLAQVLLHITNGSEIPLQVERADRNLAMVLRFPGEPQPAYPAFPRGHASGRVELERDGNTVTALTRGVRRFRLLISPYRFDLQQPVVVTCNGREVFRGLVEPDVATLLHWAARDNDRTMLFAAELAVNLESADSTPPSIAPTSSPQPLP